MGELFFFSKIDKIDWKYFQKISIFKKFIYRKNDSHFND